MKVVMAMVDPHLLPDTDVLVGLHGEGVEPDVGRIDSHIGEL